MFRHITLAEFDPSEKVQSLLEIYKDELDKFDRIGGDGKEGDSEAEEDLSVTMQAMLDFRALVHDGIVKESMTVHEAEAALKRKFSATVIEEHAKFKNDEVVAREMTGLAEELGRGTLKWEVSRVVIQMLEKMEISSSDMSVQQLLDSLYAASKTKKDNQAFALLTKIEDLIRMRVLKSGMKVAAMMKKLYAIVNEAPTFPEGPESDASASVKSNKKVK